MANARKRKARKARRAVARAERVKPTPETLAKLRPHPLEQLLTKGRDDGGIDADQFQSAEQLVDAFAAVTHGLGVCSTDLDRIAVPGGQHDDEISAYAEKLSAIWFVWAAELMQRRLIKPTTVLELILGERAMLPGAAMLLGRALDLWAKVRQDLQRPPREVSTICPNGLDRDRHEL